MIILMMGVAGVGKSTIGEGLAEALGVDLAEGDSYHPLANVEKMSRGEPLDDEDRRPWLEAIARDMADREREGRSAVVTCSALKRSYRDVLRSAVPSLRIVYLTASRELIADRMAERRGHFMPPALLNSQIATLEPPTADEGAIAVSVDNGPDEIINEIRRRLTI